MSQPGAPFPPSLNVTDAMDFHVEIGAAILDRAIKTLLGAEWRLGRRRLPCAQ